MLCYWVNSYWQFQGS